MTRQLGGMPDLTYDFGLANAVAVAAGKAADAVEGQAGSRALYVATGSEDFQGRFGELFTSNASAASTDATELVFRLERQRFAQGRPVRTLYERSGILAPSSGMSSMGGLEFSMESMRDS